MAQLDRGYGSPTSLPPAGSHPQDRGFGSPTSWTPVTGYGLGDAGFGSPYSPLAAIAPPEFGPPPATFGDEGGYVYQLVGAWPIPGPYTVRFLNGVGAPFPAVGGAYSAVPGERDRCQANSFGDLLTFTIPPLNPDTYDIEVTWELGGYLLLEDVVKIIRRNRSRETYRLRRGYQDEFKVGPGRMEGEPLLGDVDDEFPRPGHREVLTNVFGKSLQALAGVPSTRVQVEYLAGVSTLQVESTLAFPDRGRVWCLGSLFSYTGKTDTTLTGFAPMPHQEFPWGLGALHVKAEVMLDVASYLPS